MLFLVLLQALRLEKVDYILDCQTFKVKHLKFLVKLTIFKILRLEKGFTLLLIARKEGTYLH